MNALKRKNIFYVKVLRKRCVKLTDRGGSLTLAGESAISEIFFGLLETDYSKLSR